MNGRTAKALRKQANRGTPGGAYSRCPAYLESRTSPGKGKCWKIYDAKLWTNNGTVRGVYRRLKSIHYAQGKSK